MRERSIGFDFASGWLKKNHTRSFSQSKSVKYRNPRAIMRNLSIQVIIFRTELKTALITKQVESTA